MRQNQSSGSRRLSGTWSIASTSSWASNNEDAALPTSRRWSSRFFSYSRRGRKSSTSSTSSRTCGGMTTEDTRELWRCMLALQQLYGCYKSTRMDLAVNAGDAGINLMREQTLVPSFLLSSVSFFLSFFLSFLLSFLFFFSLLPAFFNPRRAFLGLQIRVISLGFAQFLCWKACRWQLPAKRLPANPFIIDTLNDSLVNLPAEGWEMLDRCLRNSKSAPRAMRSKPKSQRKFWSRS